MSTVMQTPLAGPMAWAADTLLEDDGLVVLDSDCRAELDAAAIEFESNPLPVEALAPGLLRPACVCGRDAAGARAGL